ncbi:hypothetical protein BgiBS90_014119 [Biomphalaria glabrata]|nr:hypothetical protein BgiBS90_014119 [Biomphalaria glabrata]
MSTILTEPPTFQVICETPASASPQASPETQRTTSMNINSNQFKNLKEHTLFILDQVSRNEVVMFYSRLATLEDQTFPDQHLENKFRQFKNTIQSLIDVFQINEEPTPQATLTQADILKIPVFKGKGKKTNNTNFT